MHFAEGHQSLEQIPITQLIGLGVVVDVSVKVLTNTDYRIATADLQAWEREHGEIPKGPIVLFRTGFARRWPDAKSYLGTHEKGPAAVAKLHFPGLHPVAARWLAAQ